MNIYCTASTTFSGRIENRLMLWRLRCIGSSIQERSGVSLNRTRHPKSSLSLYHSYSSSTRIEQTNDKPAKPDAANESSNLRIRLYKSRPRDSGERVVNFITGTGRETRLEFSPSAGTDVQKLKKALLPLLTFPPDFLPPRSQSFGSPCWYLSTEKRSIYRRIAPDSLETQRQIVSSIYEVANSLRHHPSFLYSEKADFSSPQHMCIICCTHDPRGLSIRDTRLAAAINTILEPYNIYASLPGPDAKTKAQNLYHDLSDLPTKVRRTVDDAVAQNHPPTAMKSIVRYFQSRPSDWQASTKAQTAEDAGGIPTA